MGHPRPPGFLSRAASGLDAFVRGRHSHGHEYAVRREPAEECRKYSVAVLACICIHSPCPSTARPARKGMVCVVDHSGQFLQKQQLEHTSCPLQAPAWAEPSGASPEPTTTRPQEATPPPAASSQRDRANEMSAGWPSTAEDTTRAPSMGRAIGQCNSHGTGPWQKSNVRSRYMAVHAVPVHVTPARWRLRGHISHPIAPARSGWTDAVLCTSLAKGFRTGHAASPGSVHDPVAEMTSGMGILRGW